MKTSTRLILLLTLAVCAVMATASYFSLWQRKLALEKAAEAEVRAHAITLQVALEEYYANGRQAEVQKLINRIAKNSTETEIGVILFDRNGAVQLVSESLQHDNLKDSDQARKVIAGSDDIPIRRRLRNQEVLSFIHPIIVEGERIGAMELTLPVTFVEQDIRAAQLDTLETLALLCLVIFLVVSLVTRYSITRPIQTLLSGAEELGRGNLSHRVQMPPRGGELAQLASAFNQMADSLADQRRRAEREAEERLELERQLRHHERLAVVGQLAAGIAHELGAPLQVIDGRAKQLQDGSPSLEKHQRNLTIIRAQAERITRMVRNLLNLARPHNPLLRPLDLSKVVGTTLEFLDPQIVQACVRVEQPSAAKVIAYADGELLQQVFLNIFVNALHSMPEGGVLRVVYEDHLDREAAFTPAPTVTGRICLSRNLPLPNRPEREYAVVRVYDSGAGIPPPHLEKVFNLFFTTKEVGKGTGLGLPVSSRIIEEHQGWIEAANWDDGVAKGAVFSVYLPKPPEKAPATSPEPETLEPYLLQEAAK
jgi:two-component system NtrC family sensor kinase